MPRTEIIIENVRVFSGQHRIPLKPLTIVTGENSSGKSSLIAMISAMYDYESYPLQPRFNAPPFNLGGYDTIATVLEDTQEPAEYFSIGFSKDRGERGARISVVATYNEKLGNPDFRKLTIDYDDVRYQIEAFDSEDNVFEGHITVQKGDAEIGSDFKFPRIFGDARRIRLEEIAYHIIRDNEEVIRAKRDDSEYRWMFERIYDLGYFAVPGRALSIAPIRTKPERIYGHAEAEYRPAGDHIPFTLSRLFSQGSAWEEKRAVISALNTFGEESGMFEGFNVQKLGKHASDPFQLTVTIDGKDRNLVDVGYGVSQALPIVVQSVLTADSRLLLLQQPEVHLHPKAQAALGSFFSRLVSGGTREIVIETHSDYILDRVRQEVARGNISPELIQIIFMHKDSSGARAYAIDLDDNGNVVNAPPHYREFFLREEMNLLTRSSEELGPV
jgi:energy-coupling factor transporter ATP-binding protein EcfA2